MKQVGHLSELNDKYFEKGLRIVAISNEAMGTIKSKMGEATYWIGSDPSSSMLAAFGGGGIPHGYLVDANGTIVSDFHPASLSDEQIENLLQGVFDESLGRELDGRLKSAVKSYEQGQYGKAYAAAARYVEDEDETLKADALFLRARVEDCANFRKRMVDRGMAAKDYVTVFEDLDDIARVFDGLEVEAWAAETKKKLEADDQVSLEIKGWKAYEKAQERERKAEGKERKLGPVKSAYKSVAKKYPGTRAAALAEEALSRLGG